MTTTKSYSSRDRFWSLFRSSFKAHLPITLILLVIFLMTIILPYLLEISTFFQDISREWRIQWIARNMRGVYIEDFGIAVSVLLILAGVVSALFSTSYLHSKKRVDVYHSLPVTRPLLLTAHIAASLASILGAFVAVCIVAMLVQVPFYLYCGILSSRYFLFILGDLSVQTVCLLSAYLFTVFISVNVGNTFDALATTGALGLAPFFLYIIGGGIWTGTMYGSSYFNFEHSLALSPFTFVFLLNEWKYELSYPYWKAVLLLCGWLLLSLLIYFAALVCYRRRKSELAEQTQNGGVLQTMVKCFAALLGAALFYLVFEDATVPGHIFSMVVGAVIVGIVAELVLSRGVRCIWKNMKWLVGTGLACGLVFLIITLDLVGYQTRVPNLQDVASVSVNYHGRYQDLDPRYAYGNDIFTDPRSIEIVRDAHQITVEQLEQDSADYIYGDMIAITYHLRNGSKLSRQYGRYSTDAYLSLARLEEQEDFIRANNPVFEEWSIPRAQLIQDVRFYDHLGINMQSLNLSDAQRETLLEAIAQDALEETFDEMTNPSQSAYGYLEITYRYPMKATPYDEFGSMIIAGPGDDYYNERTFYISISHEYTRTIDFLTGMGLSPAFDVTTIDAAYVSPFDYDYYYGEYRILSITPEIMNHFSDVSRDEYEHIRIAATEDPTDIATLYNASRNQALLTSSYSQSNYLRVSYLVNGRAENSSLVHIDDLPDALRKQVVAYYDEP